jgi:O-antigen ligase
LAVFFALGLPAVRARAGQLGTYALLGGSSFYALNQMVDIKKLIIVDMFGKDMTLTTRTEVWPMLIQLNDGVLLGCGFNSFWTGERLAYIYSQLNIIQAHNGYLETYLSGGIVGVVLLLVLLIASGLMIKRELVLGREFARVRMMFWAATVLYNFTEAGFNKMGIIWFASLVAIVQSPYGPLVAKVDAENAGHKVKSQTTTKARMANRRSRPDMECQEAFSTHQ